MWIQGRNCWLCLVSMHVIRSPVCTLHSTISRERCFEKERQKNIYSPGKSLKIIYQLLLRSWRGRPLRVSGRKEASYTRPVFQMRSLRQEHGWWRWVQQNIRITRGTTDAATSESRKQRWPLRSPLRFCSLYRDQNREWVKPACHKRLLKGWSGLPVSRTRDDLGHISDRDFKTVPWDGVKPHQLHGWQRLWLLSSYAGWWGGALLGVIRAIVDGYDFVMAVAGVARVVKTGCHNDEFLSHRLNFPQRSICWQWRSPVTDLSLDGNWI